MAILKNWLIGHPNSKTCKKNTNQPSMPIHSMYKDINDAMLILYQNTIIENLPEDQNYVGLQQNLYSLSYACVCLNHTPSYKSIKLLRVNL